ncbi:MAG: ABC transporter substrate-binding protein [bacterium]
MKRYLLVCIVFLGLLFSISCSDENGTVQDARPLLTVAGNYPSRVGEVTSSGVKLGGYLRINEAADPSSLDPVRTGESAAHNISMQFYDGLMEFDNDLNLQHCLAESYEVSEDNLTYTFHLRKGVKFHDNPCFPDGRGREMVASDVKYSYQRVVDPKNLPRGAWIFLDLVEGAQEFADGKAQEISGFQVLDDYTFQIRLIKPFVPFIYRLAMTFAFIVPREAVEHYGNDFFQNPVGTGPFKFVHWKPRQEVLMVRNTEYWKKDQDGVQLPYLDGVVYSLVSDYKTEFFKLETGEMDIITSIHEDLWSRVIDEDMQLLPNYQKYDLQTRDLFVVQYFGFNLEMAPFKDNKALRQAINYAVDREDIIKYVMNGRGEPAAGIVPPSMPGYTSDVQGYTYDPEKARQLLAEAGYPEGKGLPPITLYLNSGGTTNESIAEAIQGQLADVGIHINLEMVEWSQHIQAIDDGKYAFFRLGWIADYPDPENYLMLMWSKNFPPEGPNYSRYSNPEFDALFEKSITIQDREERFKLYHEAERIAVEEAPWLFLFYTKRFRLKQPYLHNLELNAQEFPLLTYTWLDYDLE